MSRINLTKSLVICGGKQMETERETDRQTDRQTDGQTDSTDRGSSAAAHLDVLGHHVEVDVVKEQPSGHAAGMEARRALAVVSQPDVRVGRPLAVIPRNLQAPMSRIQKRLRDGGRRQVRLDAGHCWAEQQLQTLSQGGGQNYDLISIRLQFDRATTVLRWA